MRNVSDNSFGENRKIICGKKNRFRKSCRLGDNADKTGSVCQARDDIKTG
jgi:hypothetical protein